MAAPDQVIPQIITLIESLDEANKDKLLRSVLPSASRTRSSHLAIRGDKSVLSFLVSAISSALIHQNEEPCRDVHIADFVSKKYLRRDSDDAGARQFVPHTSEAKATCCTCCSFQDFAPRVFRKLRFLSRIRDEDFFKSLTAGLTSSAAAPSDGDLEHAVLHSFISQRPHEFLGSSMYVTSDVRFMLKFVSSEEARFLRRMLPSYHEHLVLQPLSILARICGLYKLRLQSHTGPVKLSVVVMKNVWHTKLSIHRILDLRGDATEDAPQMTPKDLRSYRRCSARIVKSVFGMEEDSRLGLGPDSRAALASQVADDCLFLKKLGAINYRLLVGIHDRTREHRQSETTTTGSAPSSRNCSTSGATGSRRNSYCRKYAMFSQSPEEVERLGLLSRPFRELHKMFSPREVSSRGSVFDVTIGDVENARLFTAPQDWVDEKAQSVEVTKVSWDRLVQSHCSKAGVVVLAVFWARAQGMGSVLGPLCSALMEDHRGFLRVARVDVDQDPELTAQCRVVTVPTVLFLAHGEEMYRMAGMRTRNELERFVQLSLNPPTTNTRPSHYVGTSLKDIDILSPDSLPLSLSLLTRHQGGVASVVTDTLDEVYYIGIVGFLQEWDTQQKILAGVTSAFDDDSTYGAGDDERRVHPDGHAVLSLKASHYASHFQSFVMSLLL